MFIMSVMYILIGLIVGILGTGIYFRWKKKEQPGPQGRTEKDKVEITIQDIIRLAALNIALDVSSLIIEYKINVKNPEFYEKYQGLNKREKDLYFNELITIFSKNRREYVRDLFDQHTGLSIQDVLLLLMSEMELDNKTMSRILGISTETLKKRKTRLKSKMNAGTISVKEETNA